MSKARHQTVFLKGNLSNAHGKLALERGKLLKADILTYDKLNKKISAKGNIILELGNQFFKVAQLEYSFISEKGYLLGVRGSINTNTLIDDLSSNFSFSDIKKKESLLEIKKRKFYIPLIRLIIGCFTQIK